MDSQRVATIEYEKNMLTNSDHAVNRIWSSLNIEQPVNHLGDMQQNIANVRNIFWTHETTYEN